MERSGLTIEHFCWEVVSNRRVKKSVFFADFALFCMEELVWSPSYYTRGALKTGGGCRASIAPAWIHHVDARTRVCVDAWTHQPPHFFLLFLFIESAPLGRFDLVVEMSVHIFVPFHVLDFEAYFSPTS